MFKKVKTGRDVPNDINVIIEIPAHSEPVKYEADKQTGMMAVDRFMVSNMRYPCDYGYVPRTLSEDGDPVDALVITPYPLICGVVIRVRPIGMLRMTDESGKDAKILAVPVDDLSPSYRHMKGPHDLPPLLLEQITHFFQHYKDLEPSKWVKIDGWEDAEAAKREILAAVKRYHDAEAAEENKK
jgi:inorganic pyrophosphatase